MSFAAADVTVQRSLTAILFVIAAASSAAVGYAVYDGSLVNFVAFSLVFFAIAAIAVCYPHDYVHFFLALMWFIGFWIKFVLHEVNGWSYLEPAGDFQATPENWDAVLALCAIGGSGFLLGRLATLPLSTKLKARWLTRNGVNPAWYQHWRGALWLIAMIAVIAVVAANWRLGLLVRGTVAQTPLPWPLGGLFAWATDIGLALAISILTAWDRQSGLSTMRGFVALCIEGVAMSLTTSSRALYLFHTLPYFLSERPWQTLGGRRFRLLMMVGIWLAVAAAIPAATTFGRLFGPSALPNTPAGLGQGFVSPRPVSGDILVNQGVTLLRILVVERWTGLEGVMSTVSYTGKDLDLLWRAAFQRRSYGTVDIYTRDISKSGFSERYAERFHYASPAGPIAFLHFSGSLWVVFAGMALLAMLITAVELLWTWLVRDPLPLAMAGWYFAFVILQLSGGLQQAVTGPIMVTLLFSAVWLIWPSPKRGVSSDRQIPSAIT